MPHTTIAAVSARKIRFPRLISIALFSFKKLMISDFSK